jgi:protein-L-isoaspartate(D-aspartate) O-methyltransferase
MDNATEIELARCRMVRDQLEKRGIRSRRVLEAMARVPREKFVATALPGDAYADRALPICCGQTISQPYIVAIMTEALDLRGDETVLEIGTGSGYQTAVLAELAARVVSIERHAELSARAAAALAELGYKNVVLHVGDGTAGWPEEAPYPRIIVTAAAAQCPRALLDQLAEGGILVIPLGDSSGQILQRIEKVEGGLRTIDLAECRFVPLLGAQAND